MNHEQTSQTMTEIEGISGQYANATWLRSLINLIPNVGSTLDVIFLAKHDAYMKRRIETFFSEFASELDRLDKKVEEGIVATEEFHDLFILAAERSARISDDIRIKAVSKIIAEAAIGKSDVNSVHPVDLIMVLTEMSNQESLFLGVIMNIHYAKTNLLTGENNDLMTIE